MDRDELALQMGAQLCDHNAGLAADSRDFLTIRLALSRQSQVENPRIAGGKLHPDIAQSRGPFGHASQGVERRLVPDKLGEENSRSA